MLNGILLTHQNFKHIMKELQGAVIIGSAFQALLGYTGLMSLFLRYEFSILLPHVILVLNFKFLLLGKTRRNAMDLLVYFELPTGVA